MAQDAAPDDAARSARPQPHDRFVFVAGARPGALIGPADLPLGGPPVLAWPLDPRTHAPRDGSRLNQVLLLRLDPAALAPRETPLAAEGIVAFSAICTHAQCTVSDWNAEQRLFHCPCHGSEYDPRAGAQPVFGPAPHALAALPVMLAGEDLQAAAGFIGRVGMRPA